MVRKHVVHFIYFRSLQGTIDHDNGVYRLSFFQMNGTAGTVAPSTTQNYDHGIAAYDTTTSLTLIEWCKYQGIKTDLSRHLAISLSRMLTNPDSFDDLG